MQSNAALPLVLSATIGIEPQIFRLLSFSGLGAAFFAVAKENVKKYGRSARGFRETIASFWVCVFFYFLPSLLLGEIVLHYLLEDGLYYLDWLVRLIVGSGEGLSFTAVRLTVYAIGIFVSVSCVGIIWAWRNAGTQSIPPGIPQKQHVIDPRKWHFDRESGEYFRIANRVDGHVLYDPAMPYQKRLSHWLTMRQMERWARLGVIVGFVLFAVCVSIVSSQRTNNDAWMLGSLGALVFGLICVFSLIPWIPSSMVVLRGKDEMVGPQPVAHGNRLEDVERQRVYGAGGFATPEEAIAAAKGGVGRNAAHAADDQLFDD